MNSSTLYHHTTTTTLTLTLTLNPSKRHRFTQFTNSSSATSSAALRSSRRHIRRHLRRNLLKKPLPTTSPPPLPPSSPSSSSAQDQTLHLQIPLHPLNTLLLHSKFYLNQFVLSSQDAVDDLKTLISFDNRNNYNYSDTRDNLNYDSYSYSYGYGDDRGPKRVVVSCKRSTVEFIGAVLVSSIVIVYAVKVVLKIGGALFFSWRSSSGGEGNVVYKRDRSLGGKLVAVGSSNQGSYGSDLGYVKGKSDDGSFWDWGDEVKDWRSQRGKTARLPKWWPKEIVGSGIGRMLDVEEKEEYQKLANRFIRAMMDERLRGKDITADDIIQLRRMCKTYGLKVSIDTANSRDSLYRTSVNFVLDYCEKQANESASVQIDNEDVQQFIVGLANNIGLEDTRGVKMVSAAVAARTRSRFLQAWALEMQGKHSEAVTELQKVCFIHQIFPPEEYSPEMEMVARGLNIHLKEDQRESLMSTLTSVCGEETPRSVVEALGLTR